MPARRWTIRIILKTGFAESYIEVVAEAFAVRWVLGYLTSWIYDGELY